MPIVARRPYTPPQTPKAEYDGQAMRTQFALIGQSMSPMVTRTVKSAWTIEATDDTVLVDTTAANVTGTLLPADQLQFLRVQIKNIGTKVAVMSGSVDGIATMSVGPGDVVVIQSDGIAWRLLSGGMVDPFTGVINPRRYGAIMNGVADDRVAVQAAATAASGYGLIFPPGTTTLLSGPVTLPAARLTIWGYNAMIGLFGTTQFQSYFYATNATVSVYGLGFDLGQTTLPTYTNDPVRENVGIYFDTGCSDLNIIDCRFANLYTEAIFCYNTSGQLNIIRSKFTSPAQAQKMNLQHIAIQTNGAAVVIEDCIFDNAAPSSSDYGVCALLASGTTGSFRFINNYLNYCGRNSVGGHQLGSFSCYGDDVNVTVQSNLMLNNLQQVIRLSNTTHADVSDNECTMASVAGDSDAMIEIESTSVNYPTVGHDIKVHHNYCQDDYGIARVGVYAGAYDYGTPLQDIWVHDNDFVNMRYSMQLRGPYQGVRFEDNNIRGANGGGFAYVPDAAGTPGTVYGTQAASFCNDLTIKGNTFDLANTALVPISIDFTNGHSYTGTIGEIDVSENTAHMAGAAAAQFFVYRGIAGQGRLTVRNNKPDTYTYAFDVANVAALILDGNQARNIATSFMTLGGTNASVTVRDNPGYNPVGPSAVTVTASPMTYTAGFSPEVLYVKGGTVSLITKGGVTLAAVTDQAIPLEPNQAAVVTYSVAPTMARDIL